MNFRVTLFVFVTCIIMQAKCFCFYNNIEDQGRFVTTFWMRQQAKNAGSNYFGRFSVSSLKSGDKACCPYTDTSCVRSGKSDEEVFLVVQRKTYRTSYPPMVISLPSGGWVEFAGGMGPESQIINVHNADGSPYNFTTKIDHQAGFSN